MVSRTQLLLEDSENYLSHTNYLKSSKLLKILAALTFFSIIFIFLGLIFGLFSIEEHHNRNKVLPEPAAYKAPPEDKIEDLRKNRYIKPFLDYYEDRFKRSFLYKSKVPFEKKVFKYGKNIDKLIPILKETSHENKYITNSLLNKLRHKRDLSETIDLDPLEVDYKLLKSKIRDKRSEMELTALEVAYNRCKKEASTAECQPLFMEMYELAKQIHRNTALMTKLLEETKQIIKNDSSSDEHENLFGHKTANNSQEVTKKPSKIHESSDQYKIDDKTEKSDDKHEAVTKALLDSTTKTNDNNTDYNSTEIPVNEEEIKKKDLKILDLFGPDNKDKPETTTIVSAPTTNSSTAHTDLITINITKIDEKENTTKSTEHLDTSTKYTTESSTLETHSAIDKISPKTITNLQHSDSSSNKHLETTTKSTDFTDTIGSTATELTFNITTIEKSTESGLKLNKSDDSFTTTVTVYTKKADNNSTNETTTHRTDDIETTTLISKNDFPINTTEKSTEKLKNLKNTTEKFEFSSNNSHHNQTNEDKSTTISTEILTKSDFNISTSTETSSSTDIFQIDVSSTSPSNENGNISTKISTETSTKPTDHHKIQTPHITEHQINTTLNPIKTVASSDTILSEDHSDIKKLDQPTKITIDIESITRSVPEADTETPKTTISLPEEITSTINSIMDSHLDEASPRSMDTENNDFSKDLQNFDKSQPSSEENKIESSEKMYKAMFTGPIDAYPVAPKFHEDMHINRKSYQTLNHEHQNDLLSLVEKWHKKNHNSDANRHDLQNSDNFDSNEGGRQSEFEHNSGIINPIPASGPFMSLCDQLNRDKEKPKTTPIPHTDGFTNPASTHFTSRGLGGFPVTGESMKATAQFVYNPNFGVPSVPICFYANPYNMQMLNNKQNMGGYWSPFGGPQGLNQGFGAGGFSPFYPNLGNMQQGVSPGPYGHTSTAAANHNFNTNNKNLMQQSQPFFCTYMPNSQYGQFHNNFNVRMRDANENITEFVKYPNIPSPSDTIYASYANQMAALARDNSHNHCPDPDSIACFSTHQCIRKSKWCDSVVDCMDASDESACSCKARLPETRICDGYSDCPLGEDETGCFGCDKSMFSCYNNQEEYLRAGNSTISMCYSAINKCDGFKNCLNGNDEKECNIIVSPLGNPVTHSKSYTEGFLHRNHKGKWYPACGNTVKWAREACESESGQIGEHPQIKLMSGVIPGPFIHPSTSPHGQDFIETCKHNSEDVVIHVKCPELKCGRIIEKPKYISPRKRRSIHNATIELEKDRLKREDERVVGGELCKPTEWPFIVALYRNGKYHCGGIIYDDQWIITAAHCVVNFRKYYYEVHAGMLRRTSYSASVQISKVTHIVVHPKYDRLNMINDLAIIRIENRLKFNRYLRPACMPEEKRTVGLFGDNWISGPKEGTICTAVGWGAIRERGPGSDHLRQVQIPIMKQCKTKRDNEAHDICAGEPNGGRDACQGDSGGPLFCKSVSDPKEWYLAGVISHGEGCARAGEPGVYTRVAMYLNWIELERTQENLPYPQPQKSCPGFVCIWGGAKCIERKKHCDRIVDCLGGEDEVGCVYNTIPDVGSALNVTTADYDDLTQSTTALNIEETEVTTITEKLDMEVTHIETDSTDTIHSDKGMLKKFEKLQIAPVTEANIDKTEKISTITTQNHENLTTHSTQPENFSIKGKELFESTTEHLSTKHLSTDSTTIAPILNTTTEGILINAGKFLKNLFSDSKNSSDDHIHHKNVTTDKFSNISGGDLPAKQLDEGIPINKLSEIKKRGNSTDSNIEKNKAKKLNTHKNVNKFMCTRIPQSIDISNKCDRILDCEDGTDEEDCTCKDYLKGTLNILVCDGKTDCEDLSDEENCGNCSSTEFHCPLSKRCIQSVKRCDNTIDCTFKEDELDCFALTNGKKVFLDANKRPHVKSSGIFSRNKNGIWRVVCSDQSNIHINVSSADHVCSLLGFKGHKFYNTTNIYNDGGEIESIIDDISIKERSASEKLQKFERIDDPNLNCDVLYVECQASSNSQHPIIKTDIQPASKTLFKDEKLNPIINNKNKPNVVMKPDIFGLVDIHQDSNWKHEKIVKPLIMKTSHNDTDIMVKNDIHHYSWSVDVYANGKLLCNGVLLDKYWIAVHAKCVDRISLINDYVAVLLGGGKTNYNIKGVDEQIRYVDCIKYVEQTNIKLLHLHYPVQFTRHVLPTFLTTTKDRKLKSKQHKCMSVAHDKFDRIKTFDVKESLDKSICGVTAGDGHEAHYNHSSKICFKSEIGTNKELNSLMCDDKIASKHEKYGLIVCQEDNSGWYPKSFYSYNMTTCNINKIIISDDDLGKCHDKIEKIIDRNQCDYPFVKEPFCPTLMRCPLGECLPNDKICNGNIDCYDGSDENSNLCNIHKQACRPSEFKCNNGNCVSKTKFCDHINDCGDLSDEPTVCSCFTYLKATDPSKICDGIRNCWDKSDENPAYCNCTVDKFRCGKSDECIPRDFLCDKQPDCPNGEDENFCLGVELPSVPYTSSDGYGQVIEQSYGVWHTKCFPRPMPPNSTDIKKICNKLGYKITNTPKYRIIGNEIDDESDESKESEENNDKVNEYRTLEGSKDIIKNGQNNKNQTNFNEEKSSKYLASTKAIIVNQFSPLRLNDKLMIFMKPSRPIAELVKWNASDSAKCYRLEIKCE